jgi:hypothetical protein
MSLGNSFVMYHLMKIRGKKQIFFGQNHKLFWSLSMNLPGAKTIQISSAMENNQNQPGTITHRVSVMF